MFILCLHVFLSIWANITDRISCRTISSNYRRNVIVQHALELLIKVLTVM